MPRNPKWLDERVDQLIAELSALSLNLPRSAVEELITHQVRSVASQMHVTLPTASRYLTDQAIKELAQTLAFELVDETPGAPMLDAPRDTSLDITDVGRAISALAEATRVHIRRDVEIDELRRETDSLAYASSALGLILNEGTGTHVPVPSALIRRIARYLDVAADTVREGVLPSDFDKANAPHLADAFNRDATKLRTALDDPDRPPPPQLRSVD